MTHSGDQTPWNMIVHVRAHARRQAWCGQKHAGCAFHMPVIGMCTSGLLIAGPLEGQLILHAYLGLHQR